LAKKDVVIKLGEVSRMKEAFLPKIRKTVNWKLIILGTCGAIGGLFIALGAIIMLTPGVSTFGLGPVDFLVVGCLIILGPPGIYLNAEGVATKNLERRLPEFLRDIAESGKFGMTLAASIQAAAKGRYGSLTPYIKRMAHQISWGITATESLKLFQEALDTKLTNRVVSLIVKAATSGGNVSDVLTIVAQDTKELQYMEDERGIIMMTYLTVIYIAFFVFLATVLILNKQFIPQMEKVIVKDKEASSTDDTSMATSNQQTGGLGATITEADIQAIRDIYMAAAIIHGLGDGIVAGILFTGRWQSGLMHSFLMVFMAYLLLRVLIGFM